MAPASEPVVVERGSQVTLKGPGGLEVVITGMKAVYMVALAIVMGLVGHYVPPLLDGMREATAALRSAAEEARSAHAGVLRLEAAQAERDKRMERIEGDVGEIKRLLTSPPGRR